MSETDRMTPPLTPNSVRRRAPPAPDIPEQTRALIMAVADKLHMQDGCESFPSVDAVRRLARDCTVNQVRVVMHEWRRLRAEHAETQIRELEAELAKLRGKSGSATQ